MIKWLCNYLKECSCKHDYELLKEIKRYEHSFDDMPYAFESVYMCKKCGNVKKVRM